MTKLLFALILLLSSITLWAQISSGGKPDKPPSPSLDAKTVETYVLQLEEQGRLKSLAGEKNWDDLMTDGAYLIQGDGTTMVYRKAQELPSLPLKEFKLTDLIARVYGDTVIVTGLSEAISETPDKQVFSFKMRFLNVWRQVERKWKIVVSERTMVRPYR